ncbi:MAG: hypothetical protein M1358_07530 [Chloroflexi bacterium]|nr:hypothetical protein [Chloroflexota bacterium]
MNSRIGVIQQKGAKTGLLITKGFEDTLIIGRVKARTAGLSEAEVINCQRADMPPPIAPFPLTMGLNERVHYRGRVICPLSLEEVESKVSELVDAGIEALEVCLLWSFRNPGHEQAIRDFVKKRFPSLYVVISSDLAPLTREYERANTTAVNCFLGPTLERYLSGLQGALQERGYQGQVLVMQSSGGLSPSAEIRNLSAATLLSGPAGGVIASQKLGAILGEKNVITTDIGQLWQLGSLPGRLAVAPAEKRHIAILR